MTLIEASDLIRLASYSCLDDDSKTAALNAIIPAVITVMDAARADALEEAANYLDEYAGGHYMAKSSATALRDLAQLHREPKP